MQNYVQNDARMDTQMRQISHNWHTNLEKDESWKHACKNDKTSWHAGPPKLDFRVLSRVESQFPLFYICSGCPQNCSKGPSKLRPTGAFGTKKTSRERCKKHAKIDHQKKTQMYQTCCQKGCLETCFFYVFWGPGPKLPQGGPKAPPRHPQRLNVFQNRWKMISKVKLFMYCLCILLLWRLVFPIIF